MPRFKYFANWKSYAFAYTPSVDTVINDFTITLSYVKTTGSYYIGLPDKQYDTLYAGANRAIRGAIWSSTNIYASNSKVAESVNDIDLGNDWGSICKLSEDEWEELKELQKTIIL